VELRRALHAQALTRARPRRRDVACTSGSVVEQAGSKFAFQLMWQRNGAADQAESTSEAQARPRRTR
jgi:hypothetical protein